ncbi:phosphotransferase [Herbidospora cretacea]|uniref:phosphotransferase n=1 Tax=Herbidospora cretacea TaxID=28444 RepID=UPI0007734C24|nr:phosphotransferase [Herbidospora cretacea]
MRVGCLIGSGRDCDIYEAGAGKVIRRAKDGRSLEREASVMRHASRGGFPAPQVYDADGPDILMERLDGPSLFQDAAAHPCRVSDHGTLLADLLEKLSAVRAPGWLPAACVGNHLLHLDLHPHNVLLTGDGPRVIDWATAGRGASAADIASTWLALASGHVEPELRPSRDLMLAAFLDRVDREAARPYLTVMAERRRTDRNADNAETAAIDRLLAREHTTLEEAVNGRPT